ncbi:MAG: PTS sugar transporter subunit IIC [bacterium]|nr:PTS sugar transporter subunit IIC [bacterium]
MFEALGIGLAGAIVYLDTTAVAQLMICQPLIACGLWGVIAGNPETGILFGIAFQLLWLGSLPVGAVKFPEGNLGALIATGIAVSLAKSNTLPSPTVLACAALIGMIAAYLGAEVTTRIRTMMTTHAAKIVEAARAGNPGQFRRLFAGAAGMHAAAGFLFTLVGFVLGRALLQYGLGDAASAPWWNGVLAGLRPALLGTGAAVIAARLVTKKTWPTFAVSLGLMLLAGWRWL